MLDKRRHRLFYKNGESSCGRRNALLKIFVSYNPGAEIEQSTALRLQTLAGLYGVAINLPDRYGTVDLKSSTQQRIADSVLFVMFSTQKISLQVQEEVNHALSLGKNVLVFYDKSVGKNLTTYSDTNILEEYFDPLIDTPVTIMERVLKQREIIKATQEITKRENNVISAVVGIGLGLILLWAFSIKSEPTATDSFEN
ncbi:MAG: Uncharacterized protein LiPW30_770 [Parcubacteria group bacterium LiPW_30]|nr:MAG: Uncharacterized protein LiPW30_770 [Parcubacteria group bacterium LiPW_30]